MIKETHIRTIAKAAIYRILSVVSIMLISVFMMGSSWEDASKVGAIVIILGTSIYYVHERLWIKTSWYRSLEGKDGQLRSILKTIIYRVLTMIAAFLVATFVLKASSSGATGFAIAQAISNMTLFYIVERVFNLFKWGISVSQND